MTNKQNMVIDIDKKYQFGQLKFGFEKGHSEKCRVKIGHILYIRSNRVVWLMSGQKSRNEISILKLILDKEIVDYITSNKLEEKKQGY